MFYSVVFVFFAFPQILAGMGFSVPAFTVGSISWTLISCVFSLILTTSVDLVRYLKGLTTVKEAGRGTESSLECAGSDDNITGSCICDNKINSEEVRKVSRKLRATLNRTSRLRIAKAQRERLKCTFTEDVPDSEVEEVLNRTFTIEESECEEEHVLNRTFTIEEHESEVQEVLNRTFTIDKGVEAEEIITDPENVKKASAKLRSTLNRTSRLRIAKAQREAERKARISTELSLEITEETDALQQHFS